MTESTSQTPAQSTPSPPYTSIARVTHIPLVESSISSLHSTLSSIPIVRTPYNISISISSTLAPYVQTASTQYPFVRVLTSADRVANKGLDIAQERFPYAFQSTEAVLGDVRSVADERVIKPVYGIAKSLDQSLAPIVDVFSNVVDKIGGEAESNHSAAVASEEFQVKRAYALIHVLKDDIVRVSNVEQKTILDNIHATLTRLTQQSSTLLSTIRVRSDDASTRAYHLGQSVLHELDKLSHLVASLTKNTSGKLKETSSTLRTILSSDDPFSVKVPKVRMAVNGGVKEVIEDIVKKVHEVVVDIKASATSLANSTPVLADAADAAKRAGDLAKNGVANATDATKSAKKPGAKAEKLDHHAHKQHRYEKHDVETVTVEMKQHHRSEKSHGSSKRSA